MKFVSLMILASLSTGAFAQGVKLKKAWDDAKSETSAELPRFKEKCGTDVKITFDEKSFGTDNVNVASWCKDTVSAAAGLCEDKDYKDAIAKGVKTINCKYDATLKTDSANQYGNKFELKGGTLTHMLNKDSANTSDNAREFLKNNL